MTTDTTLAGKIILITGATSGIGEVAARELARMGATVIVVGRAATRGQATIAKIKAATGSQTVDLLLANLASLADVRRLAQQVIDSYPRLDVLINNAGAIFFQRALSPDGIEMTWALNVLSPFLLTNLLLDRLKASAPARIINVASDAHQGAKIDFNDLEKQHGYSAFGYSAYGQSKLALILLTHALAKRLEGTSVTVNSLHPGFVATRFGKGGNAFTSAGMRVAQLFAISPEKGAETIVYLASSPEVVGVSGKYFVKSREARSSAASYDDAAAGRLWEICEQMTGLSVPAAR
jgi:retinol dehydrogenase-12